MRPRLVVYLSVDELAQMRREAARRRLSLSRYAKQRLTPAQDEFDGVMSSLNGGALEALDKRLAESVRKAAAERVEGLAENLQTVMVMLDQLVLSTLTHLPEIPAAQQKERVAAGERRHHGWQQGVENLLRQLRGHSAAKRQADASNGAHP
jgi:hypothetical protein